MTNITTTQATELNIWELATNLAINQTFDCSELDVIGEGKQFPNYASFFSFLSEQDNYLKFRDEHDDFTPFSDKEELIATSEVSYILRDELDNILYFFGRLKGDLEKIGLTPEQKAYFKD